MVWLALPGRAQNCPGPSTHWGALPPRPRNERPARVSRRSEGQALPVPAGQGALLVTDRPRGDRAPQPGQRERRRLSVLSVLVSCTRLGPEPGREILGQRLTGFQGIDGRPHEKHDGSDAEQRADLPGHRLAPPGCKRKQCRSGQKVAELRQEPDGHRGERASTPQGRKQRNYSHREAEHADHESQTARHWG